MTTIFLGLYAVTALVIVILAYNLFFNYVLVPWEERIQEAILPLPESVSFLGGPFDGKMDLVEERLSFYIAPYIPKDESERGEAFGQLNGHSLYVPKLAYYRQIEEDQYFYVRDISHDEMQIIQRTGLPPDTLGE